MQDEIRAALAEQEEYIKRQLSCGGIVGTAHTFRSHGRKDGDGTIPITWSACIACGVTETGKDYTIKYS